MAIVVAASIACAAAVSAASPNEQNRLRNGWLPATVTTADATTQGSVTSTVAAARRIHTVFVQEGFLLNSIRGGFDEFVVSGPLYNRRETRRLGFAIVRCAVAVPDAGLAECDGTFNLGPPFPRGSQIATVGMSSPATHWFNPIIGGTGRFQEADGQLEARNIGTTNKIAITFHVVL